VLAAVRPNWFVDYSEQVMVDVHKNQSQICILTEDGELIAEEWQRCAAAAPSPTAH